MTIEDLRALIPPPPAPVEAIGDWTQVEATLGIALPTDYRLLVGTYGVGSFCDIFIKSPFAHEPYANMITDNQRTLDLYREMRLTYPDEFPQPLYPEPGGLLLWAGTGNGDEIFWLTSPADDPDRWPVVIRYRHADGAGQHSLSAVAFLHGYFSGQLEIPEFGVAPTQPWFDPLIDRTHVYVNLSDGDRPYEQRLQILRDTLAPTADRGAWSGNDGQRQDHFKAIDRDWQLTYETAYGHQIRIAFPPDHDRAARDAILAATTAMGVTVVRTTPPGWI